jgi:hypothetical protein
MKNATGKKINKDMFNWDEISGKRLIDFYFDEEDGSEEITFLFDDGKQLEVYLLKDGTLAIGTD